MILHSPPATRKRPLVTCVHAHVCVHVHVRASAHVRVHTYGCIVHACTHMYVHVHVCARACARVRRHVYACARVHVCVCACMCTCVRVQTRVLNAAEPAFDADRQATLASGPHALHPERPCAREKTGDYVAFASYDEAACP